eukprot:2922264-Prymnesium_polylepis.1
MPITPSAPAAASAFSVPFANRVMLSSTHPVTQPKPEPWSLRVRYTVARICLCTSGCVHMQAIRVPAASSPSSSVSDVSIPLTNGASSKVEAP